MNKKTCQDDTNKGNSRKDQFRLRLDRQLASLTVLPVSTPRIGKVNRQKAVRRNAERKKIIIVDDEQSTLDFVSEVLPASTFQVLTATSVREARELLQSNSGISLIFSDLRMPIEDGYALLEFVQANLRFRNIPVGIFTSCCDYEHVKKAIDLGARAFLAKPFTSEELCARIENLMESCTLHIALITDETTDQSILARALSLAGYSVHCTKSGAETLELLANTKVHLIISELVLEDMTGFDFLERSSDAFGSIPILFISDALIRVGDNEIRTVGGHGLIHRPFKNSDLVQMIRTVTQQPPSRKSDVE